jgi:PRTRC genetic system ThiF family protein
MTHSIDPGLLERPIRILVVGCGGNGSAVVSGLPYLHQALLAFDHPGGLAVTVIDPDTISETNCVRQPFCRTEVGLSKAVALVHRINSFWGLAWMARQAEIQRVANHTEVDFVVGCVDTRKARRAIDHWVRKTRVLYWLDLGNGASSGQFVLGQPDNAINRKKKNRLPTVAEMFPEILSGDDKQDTQPACSAAEALTRQEPFINQNLACQALAMLTQLLRHGSLSYHGGFCNLVTGQVTPLPIRAISSHPSLAADKHERRGLRNS